MSKETPKNAKRQLIPQVPRSVASVPKEDLTPFDMRCLSALSSCPFLCPYPPPQAGLLAPTTLHVELSKGINFVFVWPNLPLSSKVFRFGALALSVAVARSSTENAEKVAPDYLRTLNHYTREAIDASSIVEVLVGSYAMILESWFMKRSLKTFILYYHGIYTAYSLLMQSVSTFFPPSNSSLANLLMHYSNRIMFLAYFSRPPCHTNDLKSCLEIDDILRSQLSSRPIGCNTFERLYHLNGYLRFYLDYYLLARRVSVSDMQSPDVSTILGILSKVCELVPSVPEVSKVINAALDDSLPWPWHENGEIMDNILVRILDSRRPPRSELGVDMNNQAPESALVYGFAQVIMETVGGAAPELLSIQGFRISPGLFLCRLCALVSSYYCIKWPVRCAYFHALTRYLLWAGVGLLDSVHPTGTISKFNLLTEL